MKHAMDHWQQNRVNILFQTKRQWKKKSLGQKQQLVLQPTKKVSPTSSTIHVRLTSMS